MSVEHVEFLVEEPSMEEALRLLLPRILEGLSFEIYQNQCKDELIHRLPERLRGYYAWMQGNPWMLANCRIVVVVDCDDDDCLELKERLERMAQEAGHQTKTASGSLSYTVVNRVVIEELEAWYFGDWTAVVAAYPRVPRNIPQQAKYRDPEAIRGGTWEAFERVLQNAGYFKGGLAKIEAARTIAPHLDPARNVCSSFRVFRDVLEAMCS